MNISPEPLPVERRHWFRIISPFVVLLILGALFYFGVDYTNKPSYCSNCHDMKPYVASWKKSSHKKFACLNCHQEPGLLGYLTERAQTIKNYSLVRLYLTRQRPMLADYITGAACLRCHDNIRKEVVLSKSGIRVSHKEMISAGLNCSRCHAEVGHSSNAAASMRPAHDYCFACHDRSKLTTGCSFCHTRDVGLSGPDQLDFYRKVEIPLDECNTCHSTATCGDCHSKIPELSPF